VKNSHLLNSSTRGDESSRSKHADFAALSKELVEKELELATLEKILSVFEERYARTIGVLIAELDELEKDIAEELYRLNPEKECKQGFQRAEEKAKSSRDAVNEKIHRIEQEPFTPSDELKNLFREVAKTIHPDLATDEDDRDYRNTLMAQANEAYKNGDAEALEQILDEWGKREESSLHEAEVSSELDQLDQRILEIKTRIREIETRIAELKKSDLYQLMIKVDQSELEGRNMLDEMTHDLLYQIASAKELLTSLKQKRG